MSQSSGTATAAPGSLPAVSPFAGRTGRLRRQVTHLRGGARRLTPRYAAERLREALEGREERRLLGIVRGEHELCWVASDEPEPLVTVCIPTYNRGPLVADRAVASALAQSYSRLEVLVVGDHCDEATAEAVRRVPDARVRFVNLPARGLYPSDALSRWYVAGSAPLNAGLALAEGKWITTCDDDDELTPDHVEVLLEAARRRGLEMVHSKARVERKAGEWEIVGSEPLRRGAVSQGSVLYAAPLRFLRYSNTSWKLHEPADWNLWRRMRRIGVQIGFADHVTYVHYVEDPQRRGTAGRDPSQGGAGT